MPALRASESGTPETRLVRGFLSAVRADAGPEAAALERIRVFLNGLVRRPVHKRKFWF